MLVSALVFRWVEKGDLKSFSPSVVPILIFIFIGALIGPVCLAPENGCAIPQNQTPSTTQAKIIGAKAVVGGKQIQLPAGCQLYIYGMATGGRPSSLFAKGQSVFVRNASGAVASELSVSTQRIDRFSTETAYHVIAGFGVSGFHYAQGYYATNPGPSAKSVELEFTLTSPALVAVIGTASSQQYLTLSGLPNFIVDVPSTRSEALSIGHAYLGPGTYKILERSFTLAALQRPGHQADLLGVLAFSDQPSAISSSNQGIPIPAFKPSEPVTPVQLQQQTGQAGLTTERQTPQSQNPTISDVDSDIPLAAEQNSNAVALILSISQYQSQDIPAVKYAKHDARVVRQYLTQAMGFRSENVLPSNPDEQLTYGRIQTYIKSILPSYLKPDGSSDLFIYFTGHGAPSTINHEAYLVPWDCDPNYVNDDNAYEMKKFYTDIAKLNAGHKVIVVDACFSGQTGSGQALLKNASALALIVSNPLVANSNMVILQSSKADQVSNWYDEKRHGMFTYFFLKGLQGAADFNHDATITADELIKYINDQNDGLPYWSNRLYQRPQEAQLEGNGETIIERIKK
jgi:hypothetical protein